MGRGERTNRAVKTASRGGQRETGERLSRQQAFVTTLKIRCQKNLDKLPEGASFLEQESARARALSPLASAAGVPNQKMLIRIAQSCQELIDENKESPAVLAKAALISNDAREMFMLIHSGFIRQFCSRYQNQLEGESGPDAMETLMQYARIGVNKAIDRYQFDKGANPLTYARQWMRAEVGEGVAREGRPIRLKAKAHDLGKRVQAAAKNMQNEGKAPSAEEIALTLKEPLSKVVDVMPFALSPLARLDAPVSQDGQDSLGSLTADDRLDVADDNEKRESRQQVHNAVSSIRSPLRKRVIELYYGLANNDPVEQKDLFDGTYSDSSGKLFSAEPSVIRGRAKEGITVERKPQSELNGLFESGKLTWTAGTPESLELALVAMDDYDPDKKIHEAITNLTGVPPTSGSIQEAKKRAEWEMAENPKLSEIRPRYRGQDELENSLSARKEIREALIKLGTLTPSQAERCKVGKGNAAKKGDLRLLAEKHGLVDKTTGKINRDQLESI